MRLKELKEELLRLSQALPNPILETSIIIEKATGIDKIHQLTERDREISLSEAEAALSMMKKRASGYPMAYITGEKEFYGHTFKVTEATLIPRPDTETIVEETIRIAKKSTSPMILDLCTGSGAIAASVAYELKGDVYLSDISEKALEIAKYNYEAITGRKAIAKLGDLLSPWKGYSFDIIVSNPPYLTKEWWEETEEDVKKEPVLALISDEDDGLEIIKRIISESKEYLKIGGYLLLEGDYRQMESCARILINSGFTDVNIVKDLAGKNRVVYGRREC